MCPWGRIISPNTSLTFPKREVRWRWQRSWLVLGGIPSSWWVGVRVGSDRAVLSLFYWFQGSAHFWLACCCSCDHGLLWCLAELSSLSLNGFQHYCLINSYLPSSILLVLRYSAILPQVCFTSLIPAHCHCSWVALSSSILPLSLRRESW